MERLKVKLPANGKRRFRRCFERTKLLQMFSLLIIFYFWDDKRLLYRLCRDAEDTDVRELHGLAHHRILSGALPSGHGMESSLSTCGEIG